MIAHNPNLNLRSEYPTENSDSIRMSKLPLLLLSGLDRTSYIESILKNNPVIGLYLSEVFNIHLDRNADFIRQTKFTITLDPYPVVISATPMTDLKQVGATHGDMLRMASDFVSSALTKNSMDVLSDAEKDYYFTKYGVRGTVIEDEVCLNIDEFPVNYILRVINYLKIEYGVEESKIFLEGDSKKLEAMGLLYKSRVAHGDDALIAKFINTQTIYIGDTEKEDKANLPYCFYNFTGGVRYLTPDSIKKILEFSDLKKIQSSIENIISRMNLNLRNNGLDIDLMLINPEGNRPYKFKAKPLVQFRQKFLDLPLKIQGLDLIATRNCINNFINEYRDQLPVDLKYDSFNNSNWLKLMYCHLREVSPKSGYENLLKARLEFYPGWIAGHVEDSRKIVFGLYQTEQMTRYMPFAEGDRLAEFEINADGRSFHVESRHSEPGTELQRIVENKSGKVFELMPLDGKHNTLIESIIQALQIEHGLPNMVSINVGIIRGHLVERNGILRRILSDDSQNKDPERYFVSVLTDDGQSQTFMVESMEPYSKHMVKSEVNYSEEEEPKSNNVFRAVKEYTQAQTAVYTAILNYFNQTSAIGFYCNFANNLVEIKTPEVFDMPIVNSRGVATQALIRKFVLGAPIKQADFLEKSFYSQQVELDFQAFALASSIGIFSGRRRGMQDDLIKLSGKDKNFEIVELDTAFYPDESLDDLNQRTINDYFALYSVYPAEVFAALRTLNLDDRMDQLERTLRREFSNALIRVKAFFKDLKNFNLTQEQKIQNVSEFFKAHNVNFDRKSTVQCNFLNRLSLCIDRIQEVSIPDLTDKILVRVFQIKQVHNLVLDQIIDKNQQSELLAKVSAIMSLVAIPNGKYSQLSMIEHIISILESDDFSVPANRLYQVRKSALDIIYLSTLIDQLNLVNINPRIKIPKIFDLFEFASTHSKNQFHPFSLQDDFTNIILENYKGVPIQAQTINNFYLAYRYLVENDKNGISMVLSLISISENEDKTKWQKLLHKWSNLAQRLLSLP